MPTLTITKTFQDGDVLFEADLDNIIDDIETFINVTKLDNTNLQDATIDASTKLQDNTITSAKIASNAITTAKILDSNVTTAKINDLAVTTAKINDLAVTTAKINDAAVTYAKRAAVTISTSSSSGNYTTTSTSYVDITNLSVSITTTGRPLLIQIHNVYNGTNPMSISSSGEGALKVLRGSTDVAAVGIVTNKPPNTLTFFDQPSAGTYTYKVQGLTASGTLTVAYASLTVLEL